MKLNHKGEILWIKKVLSATGINIPNCTTCTTSTNCICPISVSETAGHLWSVKEFSFTNSQSQNVTHYMVGGWIKDAGGRDYNLLVEFDESGNIVNGTPIFFLVESPTTDIANGMDFESCKGRSIAIDAASNDILLTGEATFEDNNNIRYRFLQVTKIPYVSNGFSVSNFNPSYRILGETGGSRSDYRGGNSSYKVITRPAGSSYEIFVTGYKSSPSTTDEDNQMFSGSTCNSGGNGEVWKLNKDIWLLKMTSSLSISYEQTYNKNTSGFPTIQSQYDHHTGPLSARDLELSPSTITA